MNHCVEKNTVMYARYMYAENEGPKPFSSASSLDTCGEWLYTYTPISYIFIAVLPPTELNALKTFLL